MPINFDIDIWAGESFQPIVKTDPYFYHASSINDFTFSCDYSAPSGNVNFVFPDSPCSSFDFIDAYSGETGLLLELTLADITLLGYSGEELDLDIYTSVILPIADSYSGENAFLSTLTTARLLDPFGWSGEKADVSLSIFGSPLLDLSSYSGECADLSLSLSTSLSLEGYGGESLAINDNYLIIVPNTDFTLFHGLSSHSETSTCITMGSSQTNGYLGINAALVIPSNLNLQTAESFNIKFRRTRAQNWWDDDLTDAQLSFYIFPNWLPSDISFSSTLWAYDQPFPLDQTLIINLRFVSTNPITVKWYTSSSTFVSGTLTVASGFTAAEMDGTDYVRIEIVTSAANTVFTVYGGDNTTVRQSGTFSNMPNIWTNVRSTSTDTFLIHYHNYLSNQPETICNLTLHDKEGFVLTPFVFLSGDGYSGEETIASMIVSSQFTLPIDTGTYSDTSLTIYPSVVFGNTDAYSGEEGSAYLSTFPILSLDVYSGEYSDTVFTVYPSAGLGVLQATASEEAIASLTTFIIFSGSNSYAGEYDDTVLTVYPPALISSDAYTGEEGAASLSTAALLSGIAYTGQYSDSILTTFIPATIVPIFYEGNWAEATLRTVDGLEPRFYSDQESFASLTAYPAIPLTADAYSGESAVLSVQIGITFLLLALSGEESQFNLTYDVNLGMVTLAYAGETTDTSLATEDTLPLIAYSGENALLYLGTIGYLNPDAKTGEYGYASLTLNPPDLLSSDGYSDQILNLSLSTRTLIPNIGYSGESALFDLHQNLQPNILLTGLAGSEILLSFQTSFQLPLGSSYIGESASVSSITNEPNIYFYSNILVSASLSTSDTFKVGVVGSGESASATLSVGKSFYFGEFRFATGELALTTFSTVHHADLYVLFRTSIITQVDIGSATYFDLSTDSCCGVRRETTSNNLNLQLFVKDYLPEAVSGGDRVVFSASLSAHPRFSVEFSSGSYLSLIDSTDYLEVEFRQESCSMFVDFESDITHRLCKGYFIPNGNWVVVEMNDILPEDCYTDFFYTGTSLSCVLSDDITLRPALNYSGEYLQPSLTTFPPWLFNFYAGENAFCNMYSEQALYQVGRAGENAFIKFYDPPYLAFTGETGEIEITIKYGVRFKEVGCLDNEFVFQNDDGDAIPEMSNPVPVEGEPYYHSVIGECY